MASSTPAEPEADLALSGRALHALRPEVSALRGCSTNELAALVGDRAATQPQRHAAGLVLALCGDPRIDPYAPDMIDIPPAHVRIGLEPNDVSRVLAQWAPVGVREPWIAKEVPAHVVTVEQFRLGRYPVTNGEYLEFVLDSPDAERPSAWAHGVFPFGCDNQPVYSISPEAADAYAKWLSGRTGRMFRLPTEAEWEYAARGGDGREFPWGDEWDPAKANTAEAGPLTTTPVGIYVHGLSPFGLADMAGNVEEYVSDNYRPYPGAERIHDDLVDTHGESYRIARGGSYARHGDLARCARRHGWYRSDHFAMGFRLAESWS